MKYIKVKTVSGLTKDKAYKLIRNSRSTDIENIANISKRKSFKGWYTQPDGIDDANNIVLSANTVNNAFSRFGYAAYLTFSVYSGTQTIGGTWNGADADLKTRPKLYISRDTKNWFLWEWTDSDSETIAVNGMLDAQEITPEQPLYVRGHNPNGLSRSATVRFKFTFSTTTSVNCSGNIMSLINCESVPSDIPCDYCFNGIFSGCTALETAPELPATTLTNCCYSNMFYGCTSLTTAPELPAKTLAEICYNSMFQDCTALETAPELPATSLAVSCYYNMFRGCTALTTAPELPAETLANSCYTSMFQGCTLLETAPELPAKTLKTYCYQSMFQGCTALTAAPKLPVEKLADYCYYNMFRGCTLLETAPELPAKTLTNYCYMSMFYDCTSLTKAPELPATKLASNCYSSMFYGCTNLKQITCLYTGSYLFSYTANWVTSVPSGGVFYASKDRQWNNEQYGVSAVPSGWTVVDYEE